MELSSSLRRVFITLSLHSLSAYNFVQQHTVSLSNKTRPLHTLESLKFLSQCKTAIAVALVKERSHVNELIPKVPDAHWEDGVKSDTFRQG